MINWILQPWPWWFSGILIGLTVPGMYLFANRGFGISGSLRHIGSMCTPNSGIAYLRENSWRARSQIQWEERHSGDEGFGCSVRIRRAS